MSERGRPSPYKEEYAEQAAKLCALGATDQEMADFFNVDVRTFYRWKAQHDNFCQAIKTAKEIADERVERSLYEKAVGYERDEVDIRVVEGEIIQTPIRKFFPPDSTAAIFWLKNRKPEQWREKQEIDHTGKITIEAVSYANPDTK